MVGSGMAARKGTRSGAQRGTAPSAPDLDRIETHTVDEEKVAQASDVDAMGQDKRRQVIGHTYGPTKRRQVLFFLVVAAVIAVLVGGALAAVAAFDQPPDSYPDEAPWSEADTNQIPPNDPAGPCGEPGNAYPFPADSPCARGTNSENEPASPGTAASPGAEDRAPGEETGPGGETLGSQAGDGN